MARAELASTRVFANGGGDPLIGVSDLDLVQFDGAWHLYATSRISDAIISFEVLRAGGGVRGDDMQLIAGDGLPATGLDIVELDGAHFGFLTGTAGSLFAGYTIAGNGNIGNARNVVPASGGDGALVTSAVVDRSGGSFVATAQVGQGGFTLSQVDAALTFTRTHQVNLDSSVSALHSVEVGGQTILLVALEDTGLVQSYTVNAAGRASQVDAAGPEDGFGITQPGTIATGSLNGVTYGFVGASGSSSISVFRIDEDGMMTAADHVFDSRDTRFAGLTEMKVVEVEDRLFVIAAGSDDGLTLMELVGKGRLIHHATVEDTVDMPLHNVSGLEAAVSDGVLHLFVTSESEAGVGELRFEIDGFDGVQTGGNGNDQLTGGSGSDRLDGGARGNDTLRGNGGDDMLIVQGGTGNRLHGGDGADTYVFMDGAAGRVDDFDLTEDVLILSGWSFLYSAEQLTITTRGNWTEVSFRSAHIDLRTDGADTESVRAAIDVSLSHSLIATTPPDPGDIYMIYGSDGADNLVGNVGRDIFIATRGTDTYDGQANLDTVSYVEFDTGIKVDLLFQDRNAGETENHTFVSIESLIGTAAADLLIGDHAQNWFYGGAGDDVLSGRSARDRLFGGEGDDQFNGGKGRDRLEGEAGNDLLEGLRGKDFLKGGTGNDTLDGGDDPDKLLGGKGRDLLDAGRGSDWLDGSSGNDTLTGGQGADTFVFERGHHDDIITDFDAGVDVIDLSALGGFDSFADVKNAATKVQGGLIVQTENGSSILLEGVTLGDLSAQDFLF